MTWYTGEEIVLYDMTYRRIKMVLYDMSYRRIKMVLYDMSYRRIKGSYMTCHIGE